MHSLQIALFLCLFISCSSHEIIEKQDESGFYTEIYRIDKVSGKRDGFYKRYDGNQIKEEAHYTSDTLEGKRLLFFESGNVEIMENYHEGLFHGIYKRYYESGEVKICGEYFLGKMEGIWKSYYPNGSPREIVIFKNNQEHGPFIEYYETGDLKAEGFYLKGDYEHGILKLYDPNGILEKLMQCDKGFCYTRWVRNAEE